MMIFLIIKIGRIFIQMTIHTFEKSIYLNTFDVNLTELKNTVQRMTPQLWNPAIVFNHVKSIDLLLGI